MISEFIGEFKNFEISEKEKNEYKATIKINMFSKIFLGKEEIGKIVGFSVKLYIQDLKDKK